MQQKQLKKRQPAQTQRGSLQQISVAPRRESKNNQLKRIRTQQNRREKRGNSLRNRENHH